MGRILIAATAVAVIGAGAPAAADTTGTATAPDPTIPISTDDITIDTANPFLPENQDLTTCVGTLQRPGCGSEARGGWHQNVVAIVMTGGLLLVFGRVAWGIRRNRRVHDDDIASAS